MNLDLQQELFTRYPRFFRKPNKRRVVSNFTGQEFWFDEAGPWDTYGIECDDGWYNIIDQLAAACEAEIEKLVVAGVKKNGWPRCFMVQAERGGLQFRYMGTMDEHVKALICDAEEKSFKVCETCGQPGKMRQDGWAWTECDRCAAINDPWDPEEHEYQYRSERAQLLRILDRRQRLIMRIYFDTEFTSLDGCIDWELISAGFVTEDGRELYIEITDFPHENCSEFVLENVLPLLGQGGVVPERMAGDDFSRRLCAWLRQFNEPIELISDAACDWHLVNGYCYTEFRTLEHKVEGKLWFPSERQITRLRLFKAESDFWDANRGMQHHAMFDARRLRTIARKQLAMMGLLHTKTEYEAEEEMLADRAEVLRRGEEW